MVDKRTWEEFQQCGLLWWINMILHTFGWAIVFNYSNYDKETQTETIKEVFPARVRFRGFCEYDNTEGYQKMSKYMKENAEQMEKESLE